MAIADHVGPQVLAPRIRQCARERIVDAHEAGLDEVADLCGIEDALAHQVLRSSRRRMNTSCCVGFSGRSGNASRSRSITVLLVSRKNVLTCFSSPNEVTR